MRRRVVACAVVVVLAIAACRQIVGIGDTPEYVGGGGEAGSAACGIGLVATCAACVSTSCCEQARACAAVGWCGSYTACLDACNGDETCRAQCGATWVAGAHYTEVDEIARLQACLVESCPTECVPAGCTAAADLVPPDAATACAACSNGPECSILADAALPPGVMLPEGGVEGMVGFSMCVATCTTPDCYQACQVRYFGVLASPAPSLCDSACRRGQDWTCVGAVSWPLPRTDASVLTVTAATGLAVALCFDSACTDAGYHGIADETQAVSFTLPQTPGASQYFGNFAQVGSVEGGTALPSVTTLNYWGFKISEPRYQATTLSIPVTALAQLFVDTNLTPLPDYGHIEAVTADCRSLAAPNVEVDLPGVLLSGASPTRRFYAENGRLSSALEHTTSDAIAAFGNVPAGDVTITATPVGFTAASTQLVVHVTAGAVTYVQLVPTQ